MDCALESFLVIQCSARVSMACQFNVLNMKCKRLWMLLDTSRGFSVLCVWLEVCKVGFQGTGSWYWKGNLEKVCEIQKSWHRRFSDFRHKDVLMVFLQPMLNDRGDFTTPCSCSYGGITKGGQQWMCMRSKRSDVVKEACCDPETAWVVSGLAASW